VLGRNEWAMAIENWEIAEYEKFAKRFKPERGCTRKWARKIWEKHKEAAECSCLLRR